MRRELKEPLYEQFSLGLLGLAAQFVRDRKPARSGDLQFVWRATNDVTCYIALEVDGYHDRFTVSVAWSRKDRFPSRPSLSPAILENDELRLRLIRLWERKDIWWDINSAARQAGDCEEVGFDILGRLNPPVLRDALEQLPLLVNDCLGKIAKYAIPYFDRVIETSANHGQ